MLHKYKDDLDTQSNTTLRPPIIIAGAARSGTKLLRRVIVASDDVVAFPSEIDFIWLHGNNHSPTDELQVHQARPEVVRYIRGQFKKYSARHGSRRVLDKTCANVLRLGFVHEILPESYVIHLIRDGRSVVESARRRWRRDVEYKHYRDKFRKASLKDAMIFGPNYIGYHVRRELAFRKQVRTWGPRFTGLEDLVKTRSLIEACAYQWDVSVNTTQQALTLWPPERVITVYYESLANSPAKIARMIYEGLQLEFSPQYQDYIEEHVHVGNVHKWEKKLTEQDLDLIMPIIQSTLKNHGYL